jgi:hypothetical protein
LHKVTFHVECTCSFNGLPLNHDQALNGVCLITMGKALYDS